MKKIHRQHNETCDDNTSWLQTISYYKEVVKNLTA